MGEESSEERRKVLGRFLRGRRERTHASDYGFPQGRRRTSGLRREEVAVLAGISPTWYTYLEQGRDTNPSAETLERLAEVLKLDADEREYMFALAQQGLPPGATITRSHVLDATTELLRAQPEPCYMTDSSADLLAWNAPAAYWYTDLDALPADHRNLLWWMFNVPEARERIVNWAEEARDLLSRVRSARGRRKSEFGTGSSHLSLQAVLDEHELARLWWQEMEVRGHGPRVRRFRRAGEPDRVYRVLAFFDSSGVDYGIAFHQRVADETSGPPPTDPPQNR